MSKSDKEIAERYERLTGFKASEFSLSPEMVKEDFIVHGGEVNLNIHLNKPDIHIEELVNKIVGGIGLTGLIASGVIGAGLLGLVGYGLYEKINE